MRPLPFQNGNQFFGDPFGSGGITWQLDSILKALEDASRRDDAREYAGLAAQLAVVLAPKLDPEQFKQLSAYEIAEPEGRSRRERNREWERKLFIVARQHVAEMLRIVSSKGLYAKKDEQKPEVHDASDLAVTG